MSAATRRFGAERWPFHPGLRVDGAAVRIGESWVRPDDVAGLEVEERVERDWGGQLMCAIGYGTVSMLLLIGLLLGLDAKFAIAVTFLGAVAAMSVIDAIGVPAVTTYWLHVRLRDGRLIRFVDPDHRTVENVARLLQRSGGN